MGKVIIFSAPSGSGKTTIVRALLERFPQLEFSVSATSRAPRGTERDGVDYFYQHDYPSNVQRVGVSEQYGQSFVAGGYEKGD